MRIVYIRERKHIGTKWSRVTYLALPLADAQSLGSQVLEISYCYRFIFLKKTLRLIWVVQTEIYGLDLNKMKCYFRSNLDHPSKIWRLGSFPSTSARSGRTEPPGRHGHRLERTQTWATVHHLRRCFFLRDLHDERNPICPLTAVETNHGKLAMGRRLGRSSTAVGTSSGGAPAPRASQTAAV
jgi:hypothetical protein